MDMNAPDSPRLALGSVLLAPWRSSRRSLHWLMLFLMLGCSLGAMAIGVYSSKPHWWLASTMVYCFSVGFAWAFWMPTMLLLAIDARRLRLPGMQRAAALGLWLYALPSLLLPVLVLGACGADMRYVAELVALAMAGGMAFVLLPRWCAMVIGFAPALGSGLHRLAHLPPWSDPRWLVWGMAALLVLLLIDALRWRQLLRSDADKELGFTSSMLLQLRRQGGTGGWNGLQQLDGGQLIRQRPDWMQPRANLGKVGPQSPVRALRVALGGWYMPKTLAGHLRATAPVLLPILLYIPVMAFMQAGEARHGHAVRSVLLSIGIGVVGWLGVFGGLMLAAMAALVIHQRWKRVNAELPLLALLPGLGDARACRHALLHAAFGAPVKAQLLLLACVLAAAIVMHLPPLAILLVALAQFAAIGAMAAQVLCTLGGRQLHMGVLAPIYVVLTVLFCLSTFVPLLGTDNHPWDGLAPLEHGLLACWVVLVAALLWLARRGWRGLLARPHPFLAN